MFNSFCIVKLKEIEVKQYTDKLSQIENKYLQLETQLTDKNDVLSKTENEKSQLEVKISEMNAKLSDLESKYSQILQEKGILIISL